MSSPRAFRRSTRPFVNKVSGWRQGSLRTLFVMSRGHMLWMSGRVRMSAVVEAFGICMLLYIAMGPKPLHLFLEAFHTLLHEASYKTVGRTPGANV